MMTNLRCLIVALLLALGLTGLAQAQTLYYIHADQLNTPRLIADEAGNTVWRWDNREPFGTNAPSEYAGANGQPVRFNLRFPGQYYDSETGTFYNYFRDYDPQTGRYVQADPIGLAGGVNLYGYVGGNPISLSDPLGLEPNQTCVGACTIAGGFIGGAAGYLGGGLLGGAGGTLVAPGVGTVGGAVGGAEIGGAAVAAAGATAGNAAGQAMCPDKADCHKASKFELLQAGITDAHEYKKEHGAVPVSHYDICKCKDGSIRIAKVGMCGKTTDFWD